MARWLDANGGCPQPRWLDARLDARLDAKLDKDSMQSRCRLDAGLMRARCLDAGAQLVLAVYINAFPTPGISTFVIHVIIVSKPLQSALLL